MINENIAGTSWIYNTSMMVEATNEEGGDALAQIPLRRLAEPVESGARSYTKAVHYSSEYAVARHNINPS